MREEENKRIDLIFKVYGLAMVSPMEILTSNRLYPQNIEYFKENATMEMINNLESLVDKLHKIRHKLKIPFVITSGFRTPEQNAKVGGALNSNHCLCKAVDIRDRTGEIDGWFLNNQALLEEYDLSLESPRYTSHWCHIQLGTPKSKKRVFKPYSREPLQNESDYMYLDLKKCGL